MGKIFFFLCIVSALFAQSSSLKEEQLLEAVQKNPESVTPRKKLARYYQSQKMWQKAYENWFEVFALQPCDKSALSGLDAIGKHWLFDSSKKSEELKIYDSLYHCRPKNADYAFYYGRALYQNERFSESKTLLEQCLALSPNYTDAKILLGYVAMQQGDDEGARAIFILYPNNPDAKAGLSLLNRDRSEGSRLTKARAAHANLDYSEALEHYEWMIQDDSDNFPYYPAVFDIKAHTDPSFVVETNFTAAKEDDPDIGAPVVKNYYFLNKATLRVPILDCWRLDFQQLYYHQRENDIYQPIGVNYSAYSAGGEIISRLYFAKYFRWDLNNRMFRMWGDQDVNYPFQNTTRYEPGTTLFYNDGSHLFFLNGHRESYIIKDFSEFVSKLLRTDWASAGYGYKVGDKIKFSMNFAFHQIWIHDSLHNWKNAEEANGEFRFPLFRDDVTLSLLYAFEYGHFDQLNQNYYSYKQQFRNTFGARIQVDFTPLIYWNATYEHRLQTTYDLFQPIGIFILVQSKQYLIANRVTSRFGMQYRDNLKFEIEGHYFYETLPYRDYNLNGSIVWQF